MATNYEIPEHTDFQVVFSGITKDGNALDFSTVGGWIFAMDNNVDTTGTPIILKSSTGSTSGDFTIDGVSKTVSVQVYRSEVTAGDNEYYARIAAETSGLRTGTKQTRLRITKNIPLE